MQLTKTTAVAGARPVGSSDGIDIPFSAQARGWRVETRRRSFGQLVLSMVFPGRRAPRPTFMRGQPERTAHQFHVETMKAVVHPRIN